MPKDSKINQKIVFSDEVAFLIHKLVEKYNLKELEQKIIEEARKTKVFEEKEKLFEELPGKKIAKGVKKVAEGELSKEDLFSHLQQSLDIPLADAKKLSKEIEEKILILAEKVTIE